jgi:peptide-methionine (S)-S-oxide reductase
VHISLTPVLFGVFRLCSSHTSSRIINKVNINIGACMMNYTLLKIGLAAIFVFGCNLSDSGSSKEQEAASAASKDSQGSKREKAVFAAGCFWCIQPPFDKTLGVTKTTVGYAGGSEVNPTYEQVSSGSTGHTESIEVEYDPTVVTYKQLLEVFWHNVDPTTKDRQFCDVGKQYRPEVFVSSEEQKAQAEESAKQFEKEKKVSEPIVVPVSSGATFFPAEDYHQEYYKKNPWHYKSYRLGCGRDARLKELWGEK